MNAFVAIIIIAAASTCEARIGIFQGSSNEEKYDDVNYEDSGLKGGLFSPSSTASTTKSTVTYNAYFGYLHAHTSISDGSGQPKRAYARARQAGLDFFGLSDHDYYTNDMTQADWDKIHNAANAESRPDFVTFVGYEWTSDSAGWDYDNDHPGYNLGHFTVVGTPAWCNCEDPECDTLDEFVSWLDEQPQGVAIFNHPGSYDGSFGQFDFNHSDRIVGMELWNRNKDYYSGSGYDPNDGMGFFDEALLKGWHIGAGGGQDNHGSDFGVSTCRVYAFWESLFALYLYFVATGACFLSLT